MNIIIELEKPIPSLSVDKLKYNKENETWTYIYIFESDTRLQKGKKLKDPVYIVGGLHYKKLSKKNSKAMINIRVYSYEELLELIERQFKADMKFRKKFMEENPDFEEKPVTITVKNHSFTAKKGALYVVKILNKNKDNTVFVGRYF